MPLLVACGRMSERSASHVTDNHIADVEAEPACFKITKSDEIVDETTNVALCFLNALHVHTLRVVEGAANTKGEQVRVAAHRGERRAQFVTHDRDQFGLLAARALRRTTCLLGGAGQLFLRLQCRFNSAVRCATRAINSALSERTRRSRR